jgi:uncharacterized protein YcbK (DUF882 family)
MVAVTLRSRRDVLRLAGGLAVGLVVGPGRAAALARTSVRTLSLYAVNTGDRLVAEYYADGCYQGDVLRAVDRLCRDHRTDETHPIDPALLDQLFLLRTTIGTRAPYHVVCGYRSQETNELKRLHRGVGVASHSYHVCGRAVDVFLPDRRLAALHAAATSLGAGGVGYYPESDFVHLDTGPVRIW